MLNWPPESFANSGARAADGPLVAGCSVAPEVYLQQMFPKIRFLWLFSVVLSRAGRDYCKWFWNVSYETWLFTDLETYEPLKYSDVDLNT